MKEEMFPLITSPRCVVALFKKGVINEVSRSAAAFVKAAKTPFPPFSDELKPSPYHPHSCSV